MIYIHRSKYVALLDTYDCLTTVVFGLIHVLYITHYLLHFGYCDCLVMWPCPLAAKTINVWAGLKSHATLELSRKCTSLSLFFFLIRVNKSTRTGNAWRTLGGKINRKREWTIKATETEDTACLPQGIYNSFGGNGNHFVDISTNLLLIKSIIQAQVRSEQY